jgi:hypothetical protein
MRCGLIFGVGAPGADRTLSFDMDLRGGELKIGLFSTEGCSVFEPVCG